MRTKEMQRCIFNLIPGSEVTISFRFHDSESFGEHSYHTPVMRVPAIDAEFPLPFRERTAQAAFERTLELVYGVMNAFLTAWKGARLEFDHALNEQGDELETLGRACKAAQNSGTFSFSPPDYELGMSEMEHLELLVFTVAK